MVDFQCQVLVPWLVDFALASWRLFPYFLQIFGDQLDMPGRVSVTSNRRNSEAIRQCEPIRGDRIETLFRKPQLAVTEA